MAEDPAGCKRPGQVEPSSFRKSATQAAVGACCLAMLPALLDVPGGLSVHGPGDQLLGPLPAVYRRMKFSSQCTACTNGRNHMKGPRNPSWNGMK